MTTYIDDYYEHSIRALNAGHLCWELRETGYALACTIGCSSCVLHSQSRSCYLSHILPENIECIDTFEHEHIYPRMSTTHPELFV